MSSKSAQYRKRVKENDPVKYEQYLRKQRESGSARRQAAKNEPLTRAKELELEKKREKHRLNQARYMAKKKGISRPSLRQPSQADLEQPAAARKRPRDMSEEERRLHNNQLKAASRERQHPQKQRRIREKARDYMRLRRAEKKAATATPLTLTPIIVPTPSASTPTDIVKPSNPQSDPTSPLPSVVASSPPLNVTPESSFPPQIETPSSPLPGPSSQPSTSKYKLKTLYNLKHKIKTLLRKPTPEESASILEGLVKPKTPEFKAAIKKRAFIKSPLKKVKRNLFKTKKATKKTKPAKSIAANVVANTISAVKKRKLRGLVKSFYLRQDVSRTLPHKRYATKAGAGHVMNITLRGAWRQFVSENPNLKIGYVTFCSLRPPRIRKLGSIPVDTCLCIYCLNIKYKLDALNRALVQSNVQFPPESRILDLICCPKTADNPWFQADCIYGNCLGCKNSMRNILQLVKDHLDVPLSWNRWGRNFNSKRLDVLRKTGTVSDLVECMRKDVDEMTKHSTFREHLFTAHWQYATARDLKFSLREGEAMMIMDFAENRKACFNAEVKSAHFGKSQITLHPVVVYFKTPQGQLVRHTLMYLSDDICHDYNAVKHFTDLSIEYVNRLVSLRRVVLFSDGCASQYKGKGTFADLSLIRGVHVERAYYGSEHGKGEADGETGVLSQMLARAVAGGHVNIRHAKDLHTWAKGAMEYSSEYKARLFFLVKPEDIIRNRPESSIKTLNGCRKYHQFQRIDDYVLRCRRLSCYCCACRANRPDRCMHQEYVGSWVTHHLKRTRENEEADPNVAFIEDNSENGMGETEGANLNEDSLDGIQSDNGTNDAEGPDPNEAFIEDAQSENRNLSENAVTEPEQTVSPEFVPQVGDYVEIVFNTGRSLQKYVCLVTQPTEPPEIVGDFTISYMKSISNYYTIPTRDAPFVVNTRDENVVSVKKLGQPKIDSRGRHYF